MHRCRQFKLSNDPNLCRSPLDLIIRAESDRCIVPMKLSGAVQGDGRHSWNGRQGTKTVFTWALARVIVCYRPVERLLPGRYRRVDKVGPFPTFAEFRILAVCLPRRLGKCGPFRRLLAVMGGRVVATSHLAGSGVCPKGSPRRIHRSHLRSGNGPFSLQTDKP